MPLRRSVMYASKQDATMTTLEARRQALLRELARVEEQFVQTERARKRLEERIKVLERGQRQAA
jgi:hypothetical protein